MICTSDNTAVDTSLVATTIGQRVSSNLLPVSTVNSPCVLYSHYLCTGCDYLSAGHCNVDSCGCILLSVAMMPVNSTEVADYS